MKLDTPINNGTDQWLREMREMEAEAYPYDLDTYVAQLVATLGSLSAVAPMPAPTSPTTSPATSTASHAGTASANRPLPVGDETAVLMGWVAL